MPVCTSRADATILCDDCAYVDARRGGPGAVVGMWFGGGGAPPAGVVVGSSLPASLLRLPMKKVLRDSIPL